MSQPSPAPEGFPLAVWDRMGWAAQEAFHRRRAAAQDAARSSVVLNLSYTRDQMLSGNAADEAHRRGVRGPLSKVEREWSNAYQRDRRRRAAEANPDPGLPAPSKFDHLFSDPDFWEAMADQCVAYRRHAPAPHARALGKLISGARGLSKLAKEPS